MQFKNPLAYEISVKNFLEKHGFSCDLPPANMEGYDIIAQKDGGIFAVQCKMFSKNINTIQVEKFVDYLSKPKSDHFNRSMLFTTRGYSTNALVIAAQNEIDCHVWDGINYANPFENQNPKPINQTQTQNSPRIIKIGVMACKGGVGKTTISAHTAGIFAMRGLDVALIDLDPEKNLTKLMTTQNKDEIYTQINIRDFEKNLKTLTIYDNYQDYQTFGKEKIVIVDCSPVFELNDQKVIESLDLIIIPTTLNPLGLSKNGDVITRTIDSVRQVNPNCFVSVIINNFMKTENAMLTNRVQFLISRYKKTFMSISADNFDFLNPEEGVVIRASDHLYYWGYSSMADNKSELAFGKVGGRNNPLEDFGDLADYLQEKLNFGRIF